MIDDRQYDLFHCTAYGPVHVFVLSSPPPHKKQGKSWLFFYSSEKRHLTYISSWYPLLLQVCRHDHHSLDLGNSPPGSTENTGPPPHAKSPPQTPCWASPPTT